MTPLEELPSQDNLSAEETSLPTPSAPTLQSPCMLPDNQQISLHAMMGNTNPETL